MTNSNLNPLIYKIVNGFKSQCLWLIVLLLSSLSGMTQDPGHMWSFGSAPPFVSTAVGGASGSHTFTLLGSGASAISVVNEAVGLGTYTGTLNLGKYGGPPDYKLFGLKFDNNPQFISNVYTIEMTVKFLPTGNYHRVMGFYDLSGPAPENDYGIYITPDTDPRLYFYNGGATGEYIGTTSNRIEANTWYHIVFVRDASKNIKIYLNGVLLETFPDTNDNYLPHTGSSNAITFFKDDTNENVGGSIAKLSIYNTAITDVQQLFNNASITTPPPSGGTGYYIPKYLTSSTFDNSVIYQKDGRIGIGTTNLSDATYKLFVETGIRTRKVKVDVDNWPDYVFEKKYTLPSLSEIEKYIREHQHLPGIPSAAEVSEKGVDIGVNQAALLKKIEELTLYVIEQDKKAGQMSAVITELKEEVKALKNRKSRH